MKLTGIGCTIACSIRGTSTIVLVVLDFWLLPKWRVEIVESVIAGKCLVELDWEPYRGEKKVIKGFLWWRVYYKPHFFVHIRFLFKLRWVTWTCFTRTVSVIEIHLNTWYNTTSYFCNCVSFLSMYNIRTIISFNALIYKAFYMICFKCLP